MLQEPPSDGVAGLKIAYVPDIARIHGITVVALILTVIATLVHLHRTNAPAAEQWRGRLVLLSLFMQAGVGYVQYFTGVPVVLVGIHVAGATWVWIVVMWFHLDLSPEPEELHEACPTRFIGG